MLKTKIKIKKPRKLTKLEVFIMCLMAYATTYYIGLPNTITYLADITGVQIKNQIFSAYAYSDNQKVYLTKLIKEEAPIVIIDDTPGEYTMQDWVLDEADKRGLKKEEVWAIIQCESGWNDKSINTKNNNGTWDGGLWQLNSIHKIDPLCVFDYKCATNEALNMRIRNENWGAWVCAKKLGIN